MQRQTDIWSRSKAKRGSGIMPDNNSGTDDNPAIGKNGQPCALLFLKPPHALPRQSSRLGVMRLQGAHPANPRRLTSGNQAAATGARNTRPPCQRSRNINNLFDRRSRISLIKPGGPQPARKQGTAEAKPPLVLLPLRPSESSAVILRSSTRSNDRKGRRGSQRHADQSPLAFSLCAPPSPPRLFLSITWRDSVSVVSRDPCAARLMVAGPRKDARMQFLRFASRGCAA